MSATCPNCGKPVPPSALQGLCPECMLKLGAASHTEAPGEAGPHGTKATLPPAPAPEEIAGYFPQLEILQTLGRGGMGVVYQARQPLLNRFVALKILAPEREKDPQFAEHFMREAQTLARLNHPNIVTVYDFGEAHGLYYLLMEFVDGMNLRQLLQSRRLVPEEALAIVPRICEALQYAHDQGIVHRDIKPENVLLDKQGRVKIADFGIARMLGQLPAAAPTGAEEVVGTPYYMAPEQVEKPGKVDHRADIYSLGVVFYEMLTGELPLGKFALPSRKVRVDVRLDEVVLHALEKEPERRYQQASQVKTAVETIISTSAARAETHNLSSEPDPPPTNLWQRLRYRFWPPLVGRRNGQRVINWPAVAMRSLRGILVALFISVMAGIAFSLAGMGWKSALFPAIYFMGVLILLCLIMTIRILRGFAMPLDLLPELDQAAPGSSGGPVPGASPSQGGLQSSMPGVMWFALAVLGIIIAGKLLVIPLLGPRVLIGAGLSLVLLIGLANRAKWAYLAVMASCAFGIVSVATHDAVTSLPGPLSSPGVERRVGMAVMALFLDALVFVPVLLSTRWFFPPDYPKHWRQRWLWGTASATILAAVAGWFNPAPPYHYHQLDGRQPAGLEPSFPASPPSSLEFTDSPDAAALRLDLQTARQRLADLLRRYSEKHPLVADERERIKDLERQIELREASPVSDLTLTNEPFARGELGWFLAGSDPRDYEIAMDSRVTHSGKASACLKSRVPSPAGFGTLMQTFKADAFRGKRVRMSGYARSEALANRAGLWMRVDGPTLPDSLTTETLAFDNMETRPIRGTTDWTRYDIVLDVPETAEEIAFGILLAGRGQAWIDDLNFETVGKDVATTDAKPAREALPAPKLDFEQQ